MNKMDEINRLVTRVLDCSFIVHKELGPGLLESVYEDCLACLFDEEKILYERQKIIPVQFRKKKIEVGFRADFIINNCLILELKAVESLMPLHTAQVMTYLKLTKIPLGLLLNFNTPLLRDGIKRIIL